MGWVGCGAFDGKVVEVEGAVCVDVCGMHACTRPVSTLVASDPKTCTSNSGHSRFTCCSDPGTRAATSHA